MKKFFTILFSLAFTFFIQGCQQELEIQGSTHIYINESQTYIAVNIENADEYKWSIKSKEKNYTLTNAQTSEVIFNAQSAGKYMLEVKAKKGNKPFKGILEIEVTQPEIINGHTLPSEPDPTINNSTLLGVDVNNNGVRDDVERWIYEEYKEKHPVHIDIAMQAGRAYKKVLETPERAREIRKEVNSATTCQAYYKYDAEFLNEPILIQENAIDEYFRSKIYYNTQKRMDAYLQYDKLLSGGVYTLPSFEEEKAACDFNTSKYEE